MWRELNVELEVDEWTVFVEKEIDVQLYERKSEFYPCGSCATSRPAFVKNTGRSTMDDHHVPRVKITIVGVRRFQIYSGSKLFNKRYSPIRPIDTDLG